MKVIVHKSTQLQMAMVFEYEEVATNDLLWTCSLIPCLFNLV